MSWLNQQMKVHLMDGRILVGTFVCTDKDAHIILSTCYEYFNEKGKLLKKNKFINHKSIIFIHVTFLDLDTGESRLLGLVMIPGRHIVSIHTDEQINDQSNRSSTNFEQAL